MSPPVGEETPTGPGDRSALGRALARVGLVGSAFAMFAAGWFAMQSDDWTRIALCTLLAGAAGVLAQAFARRAR
jgi:hypothetical protein